MTQHTPLHAEHLALGARMVDFAGWDMPLHYGSQVDEHHAVRRDAGMFDVSHMGVVDVTGPDATAFLRHLLANDVARLEPGRALYSCLLNEQGGVLDDLIVYAEGQGYRIVVNAATRVQDVAWFRARSPRFRVDIRERPELALIAVQGSNARAKAHAVMPPALAKACGALVRFSAARAGEWFVGRTGYTGEDGYELILPASDAPQAWRALLAQGVRPAGLGARDTLRMEACMNLYGSDMDTTTTPLEAGLAWTVAWEPAERDFIGRSALERQRTAGIPRQLVHVVLDGKGVLRGHQKVRTPAGGEGELTSGGFSPTLGRAIGFARIPAGRATRLSVEIRGAWHEATVVAPPFVRNGEARLKPLA